LGESKNLITKEGYPTNQNLGNNQLNPSHKKSILEDSYINHDILSSNTQFRQHTIPLVELHSPTTPVSHY